MGTNIKGILACGDVVSVEGVGNIKLLATGFSHAIIAEGSAKRYHEPQAKIFTGHLSEIVSQPKPF